MIARLVLWLLSFIPHRVILRDGELYLTRYYLLGGRRTRTKGGRSWFSFNLFLHCFHTSDVPPAHNHPWAWSRSLILRGSYLEYREHNIAGYVLTTVRPYRPGMVNRIAADDWHYVKLLTPTVWTLFLAGPNVQKWGFR